MLDTGRTDDDGGWMQDAMGFPPDYLVNESLKYVFLCWKGGSKNGEH
jgi:hypothetical protein